MKADTYVDSDVALHVAAEATILYSDDVHPAVASVQDNVADWSDPAHVAPFGVMVVEGAVVSYVMLHWS